MTSVQSNIEDETKFDVTPGFTVPDLSAVVDGVDVVAKPHESFETTYYDTRDLRLTRWGASLRCRVGEGAVRNGSGRWTVKLPQEGGDSLVRRELVVDAAAGSVPDEIAALVRAYVRSSPVAPVVTLRTERDVHLVRVRDRDVAEIDDDDVAVLDEGRVAFRFRELEVERLDGASRKVSVKIVRALQAAGAVPTGGASKVVRALGPDVVGGPDVVVDVIEPTASMGEVVRAAIAGATLRLLAHDPGLRLGGDPEDVHQARVATRRLRSDLHTFGSVIDREATEALREDLAWLSRVLGVHRDADVLLERLRSHAERVGAADERGAAGLIRRLEGEREAARDAMLDVLDSDRYLRLLDALVAWSRRPPLLSSASDPASDQLSQKVERQWRRLERAVQMLGAHPEDEALHRVRIKAKRVRYAAEAAATVCGKRATRLAKAIARLQGVLGNLHDAAVAEEWLRRTASRASAGQAFAAGLLVAVEREERRASRSEWYDAWLGALDERRRWPS